MNAPKNVLILISLFIGLAAITAFAEETEKPVFGPQAATTTEQQVETESDTETTDTTHTTEVTGDSMLLVKKVSFSGVKTTSEDMLRTLIQTQIGQEISEELLTQDLKSLFKDTGFFSELTVDVTPVEEGGLEVTYKVVESPKISGINIIGNENLSTRQT